MIVNGFPRGVKIYTDQITSLAVTVVANTPGSLTVTWVEPSSKLYKGVTLVYKVGSYPTSVTDGTQVFADKGTTSKTITGLTGGTKYYFRAFAKATNSSGSKVFYNNTTAGAQAAKATISNAITSFAVAKTSSSSLTASWTNPSGGFNRVMVRYMAGSYPTSATDGALAYLGTGTEAIVTGLSGGTTYYFRAFVENVDGAYNTNASQQAYNTTKMAAGQVVFTSSQTWTVPTGVSMIDIFCVGGGGAGATVEGNSFAGGGGYTATKKSQPVVPGSQYSVVVGSGGTPLGYSSNNVPSGAGGASSFSSLLSANGGNGGGQVGPVQNLGRGGSGGAYCNYESKSVGNDGSSDGGGSPHPYYATCGIGQGSTTRAFAEAGNTLYAGGGGGGGAYYNYSIYPPGNGGAGGGGKGGVPVTTSTHNYATAGTANTGGGGGSGSFTLSSGVSYIGFGGAGGSGVVIVRWAEQ